MIRKRTRADGKDSYQVIIRSKGYPDFVKTYRTKKEAEKVEIETKAAMQNGTYRDTKPAEAYTLADAIDRFLGEPFAKERKNIKTERGHFLWWKEQLGKYALIRITPDLIAKKRDELSEEKTFKGTQRSPSTVNRYMATLSILFTTLIEEWRWLHESPIKWVRKFRELQGRIRFLSDEERDCLLELCKQSKSSHLYLIIVLALSTGMRKGEILGLQWSDIDLQQGRAILHKTKNNERRVSFFQNHALELLKQHTEKFGFTSAFVF